MSVKRARLSVIVPSYNYAHFLPACLDSVLAQGIDDLELIVVDDGSSDDTATVVARYREVHYLPQSNQGLSAARNTGLAHSSGDYVLFLDADDLLAPASLAARLVFMESTRAGLTVCRNRQFHSTDARGRPQLAARWWLAATDLDLRLLYFNIAPPHAWLLQRKVLDDVGLFDTSLRACEDYDYWLRALARGHAPRYCPEGEVYYRKHAASMSAALHKQWHHDVILHARVLDALLVSHTLTPRAPRCALLAAYAAAALTLTRLADPRSDDFQTLATTLTNSFTHLPAQLAPAADEPLVLTDFYLLSLRAACAALARQGGSTATLAATLLAELMARGVALPPSRGAVLRHLLCARDAPLVDRYRVARLASQS